MPGAIAVEAAEVHGAARCPTGETAAAPAEHRNLASGPGASARQRRARTIGGPETSLYALGVAIFLGALTRPNSDPLKTSTGPTPGRHRAGTGPVTENRSSHGSNGTMTDHDETENGPEKSHHEGTC